MTIKSRRRGHIVSRTKDLISKVYMTIKFNKERKYT